MKEDKINHEIKTDSLLRDTSSNYLRLIGDADRKARIMIVVTSIMITICVTLLTKTIHRDTLTWISVVILIISNLLVLFFTIASVRPEIHVSISKDITSNILHYKKVSELTFVDYADRLMTVAGDNALKLDAILKEMYYFGNLLTRKYKLLKIAYRAFYWGLTIAVLSYLLILILTGEGEEMVAK
jgi:hypothetical protein